MNLAGLLAFPPFELPSHPGVSGTVDAVAQKFAFKRRDYSYGDSSRF